MKVEEIQENQCYVHYEDGKSLVRKVISIDNNFGKVQYQFMSGTPLKKGLRYNTANLKGFANWATSPIEELTDYSFLEGFKKHKQFIIKNLSGKELLICNEKKANYYIRKGMVKTVDENTLQFLTDEIENKLLIHNGGTLPELLVVDKHKCCVVCGTTSILTKHHVVPRKDLRHYPLEIKRNFCNLLTVCQKHHKEYEIIKGDVFFEGYTYETAVKWMNHFLDNMKPGFLPPGWHVLTGLGQKKYGI